MRLPRIRLVWPVWPRLSRRLSTPTPAAVEPRVDHPGLADPGEVVWAWVPYEEDPSHGKDRPVVVLERDGDAVLCLPMTSKDHDRDMLQEAAEGRFWMDLGSGDWDVHRRPSEVRLDRVVRIPDSGVRREGGRLDPELFAHVVAAAAKYR